MDEPYLLCGLGNPGPRYADTRHNLGFMVVDRLSRLHGVRWRTGRARCDLGRGRIGPASVIFLKPRTYMNRSGLALEAFLDDEPVAPSRMLVIADDFALPLGRLRLRASGSAGGHRGLESIERSLGGGDYARLRLGVGPVPPGKDPADFVLEPFEDRERPAVQDMIERAARAVEVYLLDGPERAMSEFNRPAEEAGGD
jgi:PTH1 family peptidyl-tRNA hydrolase